MTLLAIKPLPGSGFLCASDSRAGDSRDGRLVPFPAKVWLMDAWAVAAHGDAGAVFRAYCEGIFRSPRPQNLVRQFDRRLAGRAVLVATNGRNTLLLEQTSSPQDLSDRMDVLFFGFGSETADGAYRALLRRDGTRDLRSVAGRMVEAVAVAAEFNAYVNGEPQLTLAVPSDKRPEWERARSEIDADWAEPPYS